jgi:DNA-nicking Smr family endonuclease
MAKKEEPRRALSKSGKRPASQHLSEEERALWDYAARDLKPLKRKSHRVSTSARDDDVHEAGRKREAVPPALDQASRDQQERAAQRPARQPARHESEPPPLSDLDRKKAKRIGAGRVEIEARIDLHGMRQSEAHVELRRFLLSAHAKGKRWVLVITGKGSGGLARERSDAEFDGYGAPERGVLRRNVPRWLAEPELRSIVVGYTAAAIRHGGDGALYVQLRRRERTR